MMNEKNKFQALTPEVLDKNNPIYNDALDYAFSNSDIKNIAITGVYGAGKSTVWKTYVKEKEIKNIITVSLGKYEDEISLNSGDKLYEKSKKNKGEVVEVSNPDVNNNRIERQIINQILSQVEPEKISLSKYAFKKNKDIISIWKNILPIISFLLSIGIWISKDVLTPYLNTYSIGMEKIVPIVVALILYPIQYWAYLFFKSNRIHISKINIKGNEASFNELNHGDETILERDMKEIVYLLDCSDAKIVVFEDLDRYENIELFTKLRELNSLLNSFVSTQDTKIKKIIRFVYMLRDGLFLSKNRTKFFDFIVPVIPVIDSKNSENKLNEAIQVATNVPDKKITAKISLYIDDMRLLKNIVNEYLVYENIISFQDLRLDANKLLALIVLKNIFPREFDSLQEDSGYIYKIFKNAQTYKEKANAELEKRLKVIIDELAFLYSRNENSKFEAMALMIPTYICRYEHDEISSWAEFLKEKSLSPESSFKISDIRIGNNYLTWKEFNYQTFVENFILTTQEKKDIANRLPEHRQSVIENLLQEKKSLENKMRKIGLYSVKEHLKILNANEVEQIFKETEEIDTQNHYFSLIRFLVMQGLIDETYWYYKGCFYLGSLGKNDTLFIKNLLEAKEQSIFLAIENSSEVKNRLDMEDFHRFNILNTRLLETCIITDSKEELIAIIDSVKDNDNYDSLISILDEYKYQVIQKFVQIIIEKNTEELIEILEVSMNNASSSFRCLLMSICTIVYDKIDKLKLFASYIEHNENVIAWICDDKFEKFIHNISSAEIKFKDLTKLEASKDRIKRIESIQAYRLSVKNIFYIMDKLSDEKCNYGNLLSEIFTSISLESTKKYIESHFVEFIEKYIDENTMNESYHNNEYSIIKIMNSTLSREYKLKYIKYNEAMVVDISKIKDLEKNIDLIEALMDRNKILFNVDNIDSYWKSIDNYNEQFIKYFEKNINNVNYEKILSVNLAISNSFINEPLVSDRVFKYSLKCANQPIDVLNEYIIKRERIINLVKKKLVSLTTDNFNALLKNKFYNEIVMLVNMQSIEQQNKAIKIVLGLPIEPELIYMLVNSNISDENAKSLLNLLEEVSIEKIDFAKEVIIDYLIEQGLSDSNINYICRNFKRFKLKEKFIEYLDTNNKFGEINIENIDPTFSQLIFSNADISTDSKIEFILIMIKCNFNKDELANIIFSVNAIAELAGVWNNKRPALDNTYKEKIGEALITYGYVSRRNDKDCVRIMERKEKKS